jgi:hypothetical protein
VLECPYDPGIETVPRKSRLILPLLLASALLSGCGGDFLSSDTKLFPSSVKIFSTPTWSSAAKVQTADLNNTGPVTPEEFIDASGHCATAAAAAPAEPAAGTVAGDLASASAAPAATAQSLLPGGVALGMTECQVAQHAGQPGQVDIGANENSDRKVVLTYQSGPWPGIYTFTNARLTVVDRVAVPEPVKPVKKKVKPKQPPAVTG